MTADRYSLSVESNPDPQDTWFVISQLVAYNNSKAEPEKYQPLAIFLRDAEGRIVGGALGQTNWGWFFLSHLWIAEHLRGGGYGQQLLHAAEREAVARGCRHAHLDTFSFQARGFYEKLGYKVFGTLEDYPPGHTRYFLQKRNID